MAGPNQDEAMRAAFEKLFAEREERASSEEFPARLTNVREGGGGSTPFKIAQTKTMGIGGTVTLDKVYGVSEPGGIHKILGTAFPTGSTNTNLFTVLAAHTAQVSLLWACNQRLVTAKIRVGLDVSGNGTNTPGDAEWIYYDLELPGNHTLTLDAATGLWLETKTDVVVRTDISGVSFGASGSLYA
jgi:hypothetical protein